MNGINVGWNHPLPLLSCLGECVVFVGEWVRVPCKKKGVGWKLTIDSIILRKFNQKRPKTAMEEIQIRERKWLDTAF